MNSRIGRILPLFAMLDELTLGVVLLAGLVDSINPCAIGVLLFLASVLLQSASDRQRLLTLGLIYISTVYVVYMALGLGLVWIQWTLIQSGWASFIGAAMGGFVIVLGLISIKDCFWHGRGVTLEIAPRFKKRIQELAGTVSVLGMVLLGSFVAMVELPCTGGPYLAITTVLARSFDRVAFIYLTLYNAMFVLPLVTILVLIYFGASTKLFKQWRQSNRSRMNLAGGLLMLGLGVMLILLFTSGRHL